MTNRADDNSGIARSPDAAGGISMAQVARLAGVSKPTVCRVVNGLPMVKHTTREHVLSVAAKHGYAIKPITHSQPATSSQVIAVALDFGSHRSGCLADPWTMELLAGVAKALSARQLDLLLCAPLGSDPHVYRDEVRGGVVDGFVFLEQRERHPMLRRLAGMQVPFVVWGAVDQGTPYCVVGSDNLVGGRLAAAHFHRSERQRWLSVGVAGHAEIRLREAGLRQGLTGGPTGAAVATLACDDLSYRATWRAMTAHLATQAAPDAVFVFSHAAAMAVIAAMRDAGLQAPRDFALVGYGNATPEARGLPGITTIEHESGLTGAILVEKLVQQIEGGRAVPTKVATRLIARDT